MVKKCIMLSWWLLVFIFAECMGGGLYFEDEFNRTIVKNYSDKLFFGKISDMSFTKLNSNVVIPMTI